MRVFVTRPENSARRTAERLRGLGHEPVLLPLTRAVHHPQAAELALKQPHAALAVTSAEAMRVLASLGEKLAQHLGKTIYAVGDATAKAARESGFFRVRTGPGTGSELAELIVGEAPALAAPVLYLTGTPRSAAFEDGLQAGKVPFATAEIYEMAPVAYDGTTVRRILLRPPPDAVLLYSRESARLFSDLAAPHASALASTRFLCLSDNVADAVPQNFHGNIKIADRPDEDGLFALL
ncbi:uroporphyrinogen-III synthase [Neorhizobium sp. CSC1952]|uniref:uroporphyrinogen-III synthase n=1 Tax=Neorhizobium sp. CSC1952 TaxID=2978974 RepID=UPI0025A4CFAD|nr:uroporphyrinogen-III synthase [Rhizobium sp. CSC1952]WJR69262.1 uroporphyrinogen-III synthase [Rhizobium sp. CSC1952]